ncbi:autotransporter outer membrane beta-barrel domain-containing protein [bacterium]|nr:autotransporter outer membrane beta-barrel domain-containing protein [bacterium]
MTGEFSPNICVASSNYLSSDGVLQNLNTVRVSANVVKGGTLSADFGINTNINLSNGTSSQPSPAFETKYKQNFGNNFRAYARYRHYDRDVDQLRIAAGASIPINDKLSFYADGHYTTKFEEGKDSFGFWVGADYKINKHLSVWAEPFQKNFSTQNVTMNDWDNGRYSGNIGITYKF